MRSRNKRGFALIFVMVAMIIMFTLVSIVVNVTQANTLQAGLQEKKLQAYYVARSGAELAYEILLTTTPSLLDSFAANVNLVMQENDVDFGYGTADITITSFDPGDTQQIRIKSVGSLEDGTSRTVILEFYINYDDYSNMTWKKSD